MQGHSRLEITITEKGVLDLIGVTATPWRSQAGGESIVNGQGSNVFLIEPQK
jgi:hypothetical protein